MEHSKARMAKSSKIKWKRAAVCRFCEQRQVGQNGGCLSARNIILDLVIPAKSTLPIVDTNQIRFGAIAARLEQVLKLECMS